MLCGRRGIERAVCIAILSIAVWVSPVLGAMPAGFVRISDVVPGVVLDVRYAGARNFVGERIDGYEAHTALLVQEAAQALRKAAIALAPAGYRIKVFDAYRPARSVAQFVRWTQDAADLRTKPAFYPDVEKQDMLRLGYIAGHSGHSRGSTVDLTLVDARTGEEVDMGTDFDFFGEASRYDSRLITDAQAFNRKVLRDAMKAAGFRGISSEWWHFTLADERERGKYYDFPVDLYEDDRRRVTAETISRLAVAKTCAKLVVVVPMREATENSHAFVHAFEKRDGVWIAVSRSEGQVGTNGVAYPRREGSGSTPAGVYSFMRAFGVAADPGSLLPYTRLTAGDLWVDDPNSKFYNRWVREDASGRDWRSAEDLFAQKVAYRYAIATSYNANPVVPGAGSAIFLHCTTGRPTAGCVSVPEEAMKELLRFIDSGTRIAIAASVTELLRF